MVQIASNVLWSLLSSQQAILLKLDFLYVMYSIIFGVSHGVGGYTFCKSLVASLKPLTLSTTLKYF